MLNEKKIMSDFESLQIKRIPANYADYEGEILESGEPLLINVKVGNINPPIFLIGDGKNTIRELMSAKKIFLNLNDSKIPSPANSDDQLTKYVSGSNYTGDSDKYARADHVHSITANTIENVIGTNSSTGEFHCRRIRIGTANVETVHNAQLGDIYIKYEE